MGFIVLIGLFFLTVAIIWAFSKIFSTRKYNDIDNGWLLLVIAHPDDETMFFLPLLYSRLLRKGNKILSSTYVLCLSNGGYYGLGDLRTSEMFECCQHSYSIPRRNVRIVNDKVSNSIIIYHL